MLRHSRMMVWHWSISEKRARTFRDWSIRWMPSRRDSIELQSDHVRHICRVIHNQEFTFICSALDLTVGLITETSCVGFGVWRA